MPTRQRRRPPRGEPLVWMASGALVLAVAMIVGLLALVLVQGGSTFWPRDLVALTTEDGIVLGEVVGEEGPPLAPTPRRHVRTANFDITGEHFRWVDESAVLVEERPEWAVLVERLTWGRFHGFPVSFRVGEEVVAEGPQATWAAFVEHHDDVRERWQEALAIERDAVGDVNHALNELRLSLREAELEHGRESDAYEEVEAAYAMRKAELEAEYDVVRAQVEEIARTNDAYRMTLATADGEEVELPLTSIVRGYPGNQLGFFDKLAIYASRWWEFLSDEPREANAAGGVWPALFGTVVMTLVMVIAVVPFGVLAALYLREYAKQGVLVSAVRIAVNNLAGVPSIVYGVFGLGFFCYFVGGWIDETFYTAALPSPTFGTGGVLWASLTLALLTLPVVIVATEEALAAVPRSMREGSYGCGASKWQTIQRIVLPRAMPGIMTGVVLAIARGAGEVAPLMLVGALKLAPELPVDGRFPFLHLERSFMHLGYHIYDLGFHSQNSEAAKPMVYTTTLLLIAIIVVLNLSAIAIRSRLRRRFVTGGV